MLFPIAANYLKFSEERLPEPLDVIKKKICFQNALYKKDYKLFLLKGF